MRLNKRHLYRGAAASIAAAAMLAASACSPGAGDGEDDDETQLTMATGSEGGTYYALGQEMARVWDEQLDEVNVSVNATGASVENIRALAEPDVHLIMSINGVANDAVNGEGEFADDDEDHDVLALGNIYREVMQIVVQADSGIETIADLEGMNVAIGPSGSGTAVAAEQMLEANGLSLDDISASSDGFGDAAEAMKDGTVDAAFGILASPAAAVADVTSNADVELLSLDDELMESMMAEDQSYEEFVIPAGTYDGQDEDVVTLNNWATLYTTSSLSDERATQLLEVMYESTDEMQHEVAGEMQLDTALDNLGDIQLHPAAAEYFDGHDAE